MDFELAAIKVVGRLLPPVPHATAIINRGLKRIYLRKPRPTVVAKVWDIQMRLDPSEAVDGGILFYPQLYNRKEFQWLKSTLRPDDLFADVGANIGVYALRAAKLAKKVVAIEANPSTFERLIENIRLNDLTIKAVNKGVSNMFEKLTLSIQTKGNLGGSSFVYDHGGQTVDVECVPLSEIAPNIDVMKIDVEGMEARVLEPFFKTCLPRALIMEAPERTPALALCESAGYIMADRTAENVLLLRS